MDFVVDKSGVGGCGADADRWYVLVLIFFAFFFSLEPIPR